MSAPLVVRREDGDALLAVLKSFEIQKTLGAEPVLAALRHYPAQAARYADFPAGPAPEAARGPAGPRLRAALHAPARGVRRRGRRRATASSSRPPRRARPSATTCRCSTGSSRIRTRARSTSSRRRRCRRTSWPSCTRSPTRSGEDIGTFTYDGDTPQDARKAIRARAHVVVTNPDMLHKGILPHHTKWVKLLENLRYVIVDELHTHRGVYGSHVANLFRRLARLCALLRVAPAVPVLVRHHRQPARAGRGADRPADDADRRERGAARRAATSRSTTRRSCTRRSASGARRSAARATWRCRS